VLFEGAVFVKNDIVSRLIATIKQFAEQKEKKVASHTFGGIMDS
jgi:hypothetical protein